MHSVRDVLAIISSAASWLLRRSIPAAAAAAATTTTTRLATDYGSQMVRKNQPERDLGLDFIAVRHYNTDDGPVCLRRVPVRCLPTPPLAVWQALRKRSVSDRTPTTHRAQGTNPAKRFVRQEIHNFRTTLDSRPT